MEQKTYKLLIVDDDEGDRRHIRRLLKRTSLNSDFNEATSVDEAMMAVEEQHFDAVILDYYLPGITGLDGVSELLKRDPFLAIIMSTSQGSERVASDAIKLGAMDYISKADMSAVTLQSALENAFERSKLNRVLAEQKRALEEFARLLVHDLKAPLQSIFGFSRLMEVFLRQEPVDREKVLSQAKRTSASAMRMIALIDQLHNYTQADITPTLQDISLEEILRSVLLDLDARISETGAQVTWGKLCNVSGDPALLAQLLQNLIGNGIKYCRADTPKIHIEAEEDNQGRCIVAVQDNGIGIPAKYQRTIFEPFQRLHTQTEFEGTGLGLATCRKIVERHGGTIWCKSEEGQGTTFLFALPHAEQAAVSMAEAS